jgi:hypothetical protein
MRRRGRNCALLWSPSRAECDTRQEQLVAGDRPIYLVSRYVNLLVNGVRVVVERQRSIAEVILEVKGLSDNGRKEWDNEGRGHHWTLETPNLKRVTKRHNPKVGI